VSPPAARQTARDVPQAAVVGAAVALVVTVPLVPVAAVSGSVTLASSLLAVYGAGLFLLTLRWPPLGVVGLLAALPLVTIEIGVGDLDRTVSADKVALAAVVLGWLARRGREALPAALRHPLLGWWLALLGIVVVSEVARGAGFRQAWGIARHAIPALVFFAAADVLASPRVRAQAVMFAAAAGTAVALLAVAEWGLVAGGIHSPMFFKTGTLGDEQKFGATISHVNYLAAYLVIVLAVLAAAAAAATGRTRRMAVVAMAAPLAALVYADSAGSAVALVAGVVFAGALALGRGRSRRVAIGLAVAVAAVSALGLAAAVSTFGLAHGSVASRIASHRIGFAAIAERPVLGFGDKGFARESGRLEREVFGAPQAHLHPPDAVLPAHSSYLQMAVEHGVPGLVAFVGLLAAVLARGARRFLSGQGAGAVAALALVSGLFAFCVQALVESLFEYSKVAAIFWILAAACVAPRESPDAASAGVAGGRRVA